MANVVEQSRNESLSDQEAFRLRMQRQCDQIMQYRQAVLRERGCLLSLDEAAMDWIARYAAAFDPVDFC